MNSSVKQEIKLAYLDYFDAYTSRDWDRMVRRFPNELTMVGTGIDEVSKSKASTLELFRREFSQSPAPISYTISDIEVYMLNDSSAYLVVLMDMAFSFNCDQIQCPNNRTTAVMIKEGADWKLAHGHWSQPAEGQGVGESIPYKILKERNKLLEEHVAERTREVERQNAELKALNEIKTKLLSIISHDLRSPFNAFMGLTEVMLLYFDDNYKDPEYFRTRLQLINERASNLYRVADNLLNWAWTQTESVTVDMKSVRIDELLHNQLKALEDVAKAKSIKFNLSIDKDAIAISDAEVLGIIVRNLISNAIKYSYRGGIVQIKCTSAEGNIHLTVSDRGVGMNRDKLNRIVNSTSIESNAGTEKEKGTGLGVQICKDLVTKINGSICIESEPNQGTQVNILLPSAAE